MPDYLEALKMVGEAAGIEDLIEELDEADFASFFDEATEKGHIVPAQSADGKEFFKLSPIGKSYLKRESMLVRVWWKKPEWWGILVSGLIGAAALIVSVFFR